MMQYVCISIEVSEQRLSHKTKFLYGIGSFGYGSIGQTMGSFLMFFGTSVLGIPGTLMGLAVGISTIWDATTDPFVGHWSDNTKSRVFGKRHGWILFSCIAVAAVNIMIWSISPDWPVWAKFAMMTVLLLVLETFNTCYSTPYGALGLDLAKNYDDRTAVQNYKTAFNFLSLLVPSLLMTIFLSPNRFTSMNRHNSGYVEIAIITGVLCIVCGIICFFGTYKHRPMAEKSPIIAPITAKKRGILYIFEDFFAILKQKNVARLIAGYAVSLSAGAFLTSLGLHVFTYTFGFTTMQIPIIMICLIGGIVLGQPLWFFVSSRTDKKTALISSLGTLLVCMAVFSVVLIFRSTVPDSVSLVFVCIALFASGVSTGCLYSLPVSMYADCIAKSSQTTGEDKTGKSAGFLTFCTKISNAFIMFMIGLCLDIIGFNGSSSVQTLNVQNWLGWLLIAGVALASICAIFIYSKYTYTKKDFS